VYIRIPPNKLAQRTFEYIQVSGAVAELVGNYRAFEAFEAFEASIIVNEIDHGLSDYRGEHGVPLPSRSPGTPGTPVTSVKGARGTWLPLSLSCRSTCARTCTHVHNVIDRVADSERRERGENEERHPPLSARDLYNCTGCLGQGAGRYVCSVLRISDRCTLFRLLEFSRVHLRGRGPRAAPRALLFL